MLYKSVKLMIQCTNYVFSGKHMKSSESKRRAPDTYGGIAALTSFGAALGSLVIGSTAYLILRRRLVCCKVSPTKTGG